MEQIKEKSTIVIRRVEPEDYLMLRELYNDEAVYTNTLQLPYPSKIDWQKRTEHSDNNEISLVALIDGIIVGHLGIHLNTRLRRRHSATFGISVHADFQGKGIGSALIKAMTDLCDNWLNIRRIELEVVTDNTAAIVLYEKFGFKIEGTAEEYSYQNGEFKSVHFMSRLHIY